MRKRDLRVFDPALARLAPKLPGAFEAADLEAIVASGRSATSAIANRNASGSFLQATLIVFQAIRSEIFSGRFMAGERGKLLVEMIPVAAGTAREALDAANIAQHNAGIAFHRTIYAADCG